MWVIPMTISMTTILLYIFKKYKKETCNENITTIEDVVFFIKCISHKLTPDELILKIVQILKQNPQSISDKQIKKIRIFSKSTGIRIIQKAMPYVFYGLPWFLLLTTI